MIYQQFSDLYEELLPYSEKHCKECGRVRLLQYRNRILGPMELVCDKCNYNNTFNRYESDIF